MGWGIAKFGSLAPVASAMSTTVTFEITVGTWHLAAVSRQDGAKHVCGREGDLGQGSMRGSSLQRQDVFHIVRQFAQFAITAGRSIAFQSVHNPPDGAYNLRVTWFLLQFQGFIVQRLQQFLGALEEDLAEFCHPFVATGTHDLISTR